MGSGGAGSGGLSTGAVAASSVTSSSDGLSAGAASMTSDETIDTGTEFTIGTMSSLSGQRTKNIAATPACSSSAPRIAGDGARVATLYSSAAVSVIRLILVKPEAESRAITRATA